MKRKSKDRNCRNFRITKTTSKCPWEVKTLTYSY